MHTLVEELKRRRVFRVAGIYAVMSWIIAEVADVVFPALKLPEWTVTFVVALLILGFPVAMFFAWVFDIGPGGLQRTEPLAERAGGIPGLERMAYLVLLALAMGGLAWALFPGLGGVAGFGLPGQPRDSIAVLPFANLSSDPGNDYFSEGISEELLNLLARVPNLSVAARTSSFAFKGQNLDVRTVAQQLGVDTVLEGSVRKQGDRVRITAQLIDAGTGYHLWSETYDRRLEDIFQVQDEIASEIVKALRMTLGGEDAASMTMVAREQPPTRNLEAYQLYLQARHQWKRRGETSLRRSIDLLEQALRLDPEFARAYSALAAAYVVLPGYAGESPHAHYEKAAEAARQALARDPNLAEAHAVLATIDQNEWDWADAEAGFFFATSLDPNDATTRQWYSLLLRQAGRLEKSLEEARKALELDPTSPIINRNLADLYSTMGYDEQALKYLRDAEGLGLDVQAARSGIPTLAAFRAGDLETLRASIVAETSGEDGEGIGEELLDAIMAVVADRARWPELDAALQRHEAEIPMKGRYDLYLLLDRPEQALEVARLTIADRGLDLDKLWVPEAAELRLLPGFRELVREAGLVEYWKQYGWPDDCRPVADGFRCGLTSVAAAD